MIEAGSVPSKNSAALKRALGWYFLFGVAVALLATESVVPSVPGLATAIDALAKGVPSINRMSAVSTFPESMKLFMSVMWLALPIASYRTYVGWTLFPRTPMLRKSDLWFLVASSWLIAFVPVSLLYFFFDITRLEIEQVGGRGGWLIVLITQYRLGLAVIGTTCFCVGAGCLGVALRVTVIAARATFFKPRPNDVSEEGR